jgi:hypothetical protein
VGAGRFGLEMRMLFESLEFCSIRFRLGSSEASRLAHILVLLRVGLSISVSFLAYLENGYRFVLPNSVARLVLEDSG